jgi:tetratricopeptide (TPR) repeat protein
MLAASSSSSAASAASSLAQRRRPPPSLNIHRRRPSVTTRFAAALPSPLPSPLSTTAYDGEEDPFPLPQPTAGSAAAAAAAALSEDAAALHAHALSLARAEAYAEARLAFERLLGRYPSFCTAWTSYAQMEKRAAKAATATATSGADRFAACRAVLQRGLALNPTSACLVQAWGLMELQKNNAWAAVRLLERGAALDPRRNSAVLRWVPVRRAAATATTSRGLAGVVGGGGGVGEGDVESDGGRVA